MRDAGCHSGHARCTESGFGASSFARAGRGGAGGAGGSGVVSGCGFLATGSGMPLIVQPQSEHDVSAGTSARMNSWPFCLHARCPRAGHTQTLAHASQCVAAERVSTSICVHRARVSWISKQPGIICPSRAKVTCARSCTFCIRPTLCSRSRSAVRAGACVWSTVTRTGYIREGGKGGCVQDVGSFSMEAATHRVAVAAGALSCLLVPSWRCQAAPPPGLTFGGHLCC